jgi:hypothetical protein
MTALSCCSCLSATSTFSSSSSPAAELGSMAAQREELLGLLEAHNVHLGAAAEEARDLRVRLPLASPPSSS